MPLIKVRYGLIEQDNLYLSSPAYDFLGNGSWHRTQEMFKLKLGKIIRTLPYDRFVIDVEKDITSNGIYEFFVSNGERYLGLLDEYNTDITNWRITYINEFFQVFTSKDYGLTWINNSGKHVVFNGSIFQGFNVIDGNELGISDYKVYHSPYLTIQNFETGLIARLEDSNGNILERSFNNNYECTFFMDNNKKCTLSIYDDSGSNLLYIFENMYFTMGDIYAFTQYNIQLINNGEILDFSIHNLDEQVESFIIKNLDSHQINNISIKLLSSTDNTVENVSLSWDGVLWLNSLKIESLSPEEERNFYAKISLDKTQHWFKLNKFEVVIY